MQALFVDYAIINLYSLKSIDIFTIGVVVSGVVAAGLSWVFIATQHLHGRFSLDMDVGPQKFHCDPTPRIGGLAIFIALVAGFLFAADHVSQLLGKMLIAALPAFAAGLTEDLTKRVSVSKRLAATFLSALLAWWFTGYALDHLAVWGLDALLYYLPASVLFTSFAVAGVANSVNIIDGFNGLASGSVMIALLAMGMIAAAAGDLTLFQVCVTVAAVVAGFMLFNFPLGKIFMGDGGAYLLGFLLAWIAVMLPSRNPEVSVWAPLLACAYPINETIFTIIRRFFSNGSLGSPDSSHLHSLIKIMVVRRHFTALRPWMRNSIVSPFCWAYAAVFAVAGVILYKQTALLMVAWAASFAAYALLYTLVNRYKGAGLR